MEKKGGLFLVVFAFTRKVCNKMDCVHVVLPCVGGHARGAPPGWHLLARTVEDCCF